MNNLEQKASPEFLHRLTQGPILADGAMGTELLRRSNLGVESCLEQLNLTAPELVRAIHLDYIEAGAELIETNTYGANRIRLEHHGLSNSVQELNQSAVKICKEAMRLTGQHVWIAGTIGPLGKSIAPLGPITRSQAKEVFQEQALALINANVDLLVLETFTSLAEIQLAVSAVKDTDSTIPIVALLTFTEDGLTLAEETPSEAAISLSALGVASLGTNCSVGPASMVKVIEEMAHYTSVPLTAMPNAGFPTYVDGRFVYLSSPSYMAQHADQLLESGADIIGGCCGTTSEHTTAMRTALRKRRAPRIKGKPEPRTKLSAQQPKLPLAAASEPTELAQRLGKQFVVTVEVDPPQGFDVTTTLSQLRNLIGKTHVDAFNVSDNPTARPRMSALAMSTLIQTRLGVEAILHIATRHRNLLALHSDLLGAHSLGVRNIFAVMGDLPYIGDYPHATAVSDVTPSGLMALMQHSNTGLDLAGHPIQQATSFLVGCALNMGAANLDRELHGLERKLKSGADFILTQAIFDPLTFEEFERRIGGFPVPILIGILPLSNIRHAEFLHNEVPGIVIPENVLKRMRGSGRRSQEEGISLSRELLKAIAPKINGAYLMPSFGKYDVVAQVLDGLPDLIS